MTSKLLIDKVMAIAERMYDEWFSDSPHTDPRMEADIKRTYVAGFTEGYVFARTGKLAEDTTDDQPS